MTTEEAITRLNSLLDSITNVYIFFSKKNMFSSRTNILSEDTIAIKMAIKALSEQEEQKWVPCSENRFPNEETDVLVCNANGDEEICCGWKSTEIEAWDWATSGWRFGKVIAWRPLPYPYKERQEE